MAGFLDAALDFGKDLLTGAATVAGGALGGPVVGAAAGSAVDWLLGGDEEDKKAESREFGLQNSSGAGGAGSSFPSPAQGGVLVPTQPGGGLQGPVYGAQGVPQQIAGALKSILTMFAQNPQLAQYVQRFWDFPRGEQVKAQQQPLAWALLANQLPEYMREALEQFMLGLPGPMGLSQAGEDAFKMLLIAEAGYVPQMIGLCKYADK